VLLGCDVVGLTTGLTNGGNPLGASFGDVGFKSGADIGPPGAAGAAAGASDFVFSSGFGATAGADIDPVAGGGLSVVTGATARVEVEADCTETVANAQIRNTLSLKYLYDIFSLLNLDQY
jgi:hypothetical protein